MKRNSILIMFIAIFCLATFAACTKEVTHSTATPVDNYSIIKNKPNPIFWPDTVVVKGR